MNLLNGENNNCIDVSDRGFQYGDGLFETIEVLDGYPVFFKQHVKRLLMGCDRLKIPPPEVALLKQEVLQLVKGSQQAVLKIIITRGSGGRGYRQPEFITATRFLSLHPFPEYPESYSQNGINVRFCNLRLGLNPALAGIKHMNRLEQVLARAEWQSSAIQEGLMLDINDDVIEGTMSNVFWTQNNTLFTPAIKFCGVEGVLRNIIIALARKKGIQVVEKTIKKEQLMLADELFVSNSIIGIWPVKKLEGVTFKIGAITQLLQELLYLFKQEVVNDF